MLVSGSITPSALQLVCEQAEGKRSPVPCFHGELLPNCHGTGARMRSFHYGIGRRHGDWGVGVNR
jgi:hypothetical protein